MDRSRSRSWPKRPKNRTGLDFQALQSRNHAECEHPCVLASVVLSNGQNWYVNHTLGNNDVSGLSNKESTLLSARKVTEGVSTNSTWLARVDRSRCRVGGVKMGSK